jgi:hypothetical protein
MDISDKRYVKDRGRYKEASPTEHQLSVRLHEWLHWYGITILVMFPIALSLACRVWGARAMLDCVVSQWGPRPRRDLLNRRPNAALKGPFASRREP